MIAAITAGLALGVGSAAHCAAMCGPLAALGCSARHGRASWASYLGGRMLSYVTLGTALGALSEQTLGALRGPWPSAVASWALAAALAAAALRLWYGARPTGPGAAPSTLLQLRAPARPGWTERWLSPVWRQLASWPPAGVGAAQALLPCGALAAALIVAAGQGSAAAGGLTMAGFATTSSVGLLGVGLLGKGLSRWRSTSAVRALSVALAVGAVLMLVRPLPALRAPDAKPAPCPLHAAAQ